MIVSDNCSTDSTADVVLKYKNLLDLKYIVSQDNYGYETNFGSAISMASGKYSLYLSDDLLDIESVFELSISWKVISLFQQFMLLGG